MCALHNLVLNDLKDNEFTAGYMRRVVLTLVCLLFLTPSVAANYSSNQSLQNGKVWIDCENSWIEIIDENNNTIVNSSNYLGDIESGNYTVNSPNISDCQTILPISQDFPNDRPVPGASFDSIDVDTCPQTGVSIACEGVLLAGDLGNDTSDIFAINVSSADILKVDVEASSSSLDIDFHFQNSTRENKLEAEMYLNRNTSIGESNTLYLAVEEEGRIIVTISSPNPDTAWAITVSKYTIVDTAMVETDGDITGVGAIPIGIELGQDESITITQISGLDVPEDNQSAIPVYYRFVYSENSNSEWSNLLTNQKLFGIRDISHVELIFDCLCEWTASISKQTHFDARLNSDAPNFIPLSSSSDNSSYPLIEMSGDNYEGELTLMNGDFKDILRVEVEGWNDSVHLIDVIVEGDIYDLQLTIWELDQTNWNILESASATYSMSSVRGSLDVGPGTHFIQISHVDGPNSTTSEVNSTQWQIRVSTAILEEGEEPWFPTEDVVYEAANLFYWIIGIILITPFILFYLFVRREKQFAEEFASKKNRLEWLTKQLDTGVDTEIDLKRALRAVSSLEWEKALEVWGECQSRHYTSGIDIALWSLDRRLAEKGQWPLLIGVRAQENDWNVSAIRFESPQGEAWKVVEVVPNLLNRGDEIFLDSIIKNSRLFFKVVIEGSADSLDVHLSGIVGGNPIAAKLIDTIYKPYYSEEE